MYFLNILYIYDSEVNLSILIIKNKIYKTVTSGNNTDKVPCVFIPETYHRNLKLRKSQNNVVLYIKNAFWKKSKKEKERVWGNRENNSFPFGLKQSGV